MSDASPHSEPTDFERVRWALQEAFQYHDAFEALDSIAEQLQTVEDNRTTWMYRARKIEEQFEALRSACEVAWSYGSQTLKSEDYYAIQALIFGTEGGTTGHGTATAASVGSVGGGASPRSEVGAEAASSPASRSHARAHRTGGSKRLPFRAGRRATGPRRGQRRALPSPSRWLPGLGCRRIGRFPPRRREGQPTADCARLPPAPASYRRRHHPD